MDRDEKKQFLKKNGWWCHYHEDCWFESSKDNLYVEKDTGLMKGFRPISGGLKLEKAFKVLIKKKKK